MRIVPYGKAPVKVRVAAETLKFAHFPIQGSKR